jgi:apolipoprotein N-acyltransferase
LTKEISNSNLFAISFILSLAYLLGFEPFGFQIVGLLSISGLLFAALNTDEKKASLIFFLFGLFVYSIGLYWLYISIHIISGAPKILAVLLIILLASYLSLYHAIFGFNSIASRVSDLSASFN